MQRFECSMETEILAAVAEGRWPEGVDQELRAHVEQCGICADIVMVAGALLSERQELRSIAVVPDAGQVWWKAQLRARREAAEAAGRPITAAQLVAFGCAVGLLGACFGATSEWFQAGFKWVVGHLAEIRAAALTPIAGHALIALGVAALLLLIPAALILAAGRD